MSFNAKLFELMLYPDSFKVVNLDAYLHSLPGLRDFAYILHDMDGVKEHYHLALRMTDTRNSSNICKHFGVPENLISRVKGRWTDMLKYLTHANAPDKHQYDVSLVTSNFDWQKEIEKDNSRKRVDEIVSMIVSGVIREYNYFEHITGIEYVKYKRQIDSAFAYRSDKLRGVNREMNAVYIKGDAGVGKTTYAKMIAENKGYSIFISSSSNDVLDGYAGQECIILDDLRPSALGLADLLKLLDNHTSSTVKSRYRNKVLECKLILITSTLDIDVFFRNVFSEEEETIVQLKRRCTTHMYMKPEVIEVSVYDNVLRDYDVPFIIQNPVTKMFKFERLTREQQGEFVRDLLGDVEFCDEEKPSEEEDWIRLLKK